MNNGFSFSDFKEAVKAFFSNPLISVPSILILLIIYLSSPYVYRINSLFQQNYQLYFSTFIFSMIYLVLIAFFLTTLISALKNALQGKKTKEIISNSIKDSFSLWYKNLFFIILIIILYNLTRLIAHYLAFFAGSIFNLSVKPAAFLFFIIYILGILGFLIFFSLSNFVCIIKRFSMKKSISSSFLIVKSNYLTILSMFLIYFVISQLISLINGNISEIVGAAILTPILSIILSKIVLKN